MNKRERVGGFGGGGRRSRVIPRVIRPSEIAVRVNGTIEAGDTRGPPTPATLSHLSPDQVLLAHFR